MNPGRRDAVSHVSLVRQEMTAAPVETVQFQYLRVCLCYKFACRYQLRLENPGSFKAPHNTDNIRWESLERFAAVCGSQWEHNGFWQQGLPGAASFGRLGYIQLVTSFLVYFFAASHIWGISRQQQQSLLGRYFVLVLITWLWKVRCTQLFSVRGDIGHILVLLT